MAKDKLLDARIGTINVALVKIKDDVEQECMPCYEHHMKMITDVLYDIQFDLEEKIEASNS